MPPRLPLLHESCRPHLVPTLPPHDTTRRRENPMSYTATYSPEDNKLRLYSTTRLDSETYARVKEAGFIWAPKQDLFVAPIWTPSREDLLIKLVGEDEDEDR